MRGNTRFEIGAYLLYARKRMSSAQESKLPFFILIPFVVVVLALAYRAGAPTEPLMPGVGRPVVPVISAPVVVETPAVPTPPAALAPPAASTESWE